MSSVLCNQSITGTLGVNTTAPSSGIKVVGTDGAAKLYYNSSFTAARYSVLQIGMMTSGTIADGFGGNLVFRTGGNGYDGYQAASIGTERNGHDGTHDLVFATSTTGSSTDKMIIKNDGKVGINTDTPSTQLHVVGTSRFGGSSDYIELNSSGNIMLADSNCTIGPVYTGSPSNTLSIGFTMTGVWHTIKHHFSTEVIWGPGVLGQADGMNLNNNGNLSIKGDLTVGGGDISGVANMYNTSLKIGGASGTNEINFAAGKIAFTSASTSLAAMSGTYFRPGSDNSIKLGDTTYGWSEVHATSFIGDLNGTINTATTATTQSQGNNSTKVATTAYVDAYTPTNTQTILFSNFQDSGSTTSSLRIPFNTLSETSSNQYYNHFDCPADGTIKRIRMHNTSGSMSTSFTTIFDIYKNVSSGSPTQSSGSLTASSGSIEYEPNLSFSKGDGIQVAYRKSAGAKYWQGVSASIILEFEQV